MNDYEDEMFGSHFADVYDDIYRWYVPSRAQCDFLVGRFGRETVLEVGAGTGRLSIPLAERGMPVIALDISKEMLAVLETKIDGLPITPLCCDGANYALPDKVAGVIAVFNMITLFNGREEQSKFFHSAAAALQPGGELVIETLVPHEDALPGISGLTVRTMSAEQVILEVGRHIPAAQRCEFQYVVLRHNEPVKLLPHRMHYLWPTQVDELASEAGLRLTERYADWRRSRFTEASRSHISVYQLEDRSPAESSDGP